MSSSTKPEVGIEPKDPKITPTTPDKPKVVPEDPKEKDTAEPETGGLSQYRKVDDGIKRIVEKVQDQIKEEIKLLTKGKVPDKLEIVGYRMNVVYGFMYYAKIKIPGKSFIQAKILETPNGEIKLHTVHETKTDEDEREYFKLPK